MRHIHAARAKSLLKFQAEGCHAAAACGDDSGDDSSSSDTTSADGSSDTTTAQSDLTVGIVYDLGGRGDQSFNDSAAAGMDKAKADFGVTQA